MTNRPRFVALRYRDYRRTWLANMLSGAAMWTVIVASGWLVFKETDSSTWVGIVTFSAMLPMLIASPVGGLLGDRYDRRKLAIAMFMASSAIVAALTVLSVSGALQIWHVAALAFAGGIVRALKEPAMQALIPNQVPREDLLNALILNGATRHGARFFGLLVASPLLALDLFGVNGVLALGSVLYAVGAVVMSRARTVSSGETRPDYGVLRNMVDGLVYIYSHRTLALFIVLVAFHCSLVMSFESMLPIFSRESLGATDASVYGYLVMGFGAGALAGMMLMAGLQSERRRGQLLMLTGVASGAAPILLALSGTAPLAVLVSAGMGASQATFMALINTYVQTIAPDRLRSRISSLYVMHAGGTMAFANLGYGFLADVFSAPPIMLATGAIFMVVVLGTGAGQPILRRVYTTGQVAAA